MDDNQVKNGREAFAAVKQHCRVLQHMLGGSRINTKEMLGKIGRWSSKRISWQDDDDYYGDVFLDDDEKHRSDSSPGSADRDNSRLFSWSMGVLGNRILMQEIIQEMEEDKGSERRFCKLFGDNVQFCT